MGNAHQHRIRMLVLGASSYFAMLVVSLTVSGLDLGWVDGAPAWFLFISLGVAGVLVSRFRGPAWFFPLGVFGGVAVHQVARGAPAWYALLLGALFALAGLAGVVATHAAGRWWGGSQRA